MSDKLQHTNDNSALRRALVIVAVANLLYFFIEFTAATSIRSVSLFADSVDFFEDASVNLLVFLAIAWNRQNRARLGFALAAILFVPGIATVISAIYKIAHPTAPSPVVLSGVGFGALIVNCACAFLLARHRESGGSIMRAAFLSARNDALVNIAIIIAALCTATVWRSAWPDLIVGIATAGLNIDAARQVLRSAHAEAHAGAHG